MLAANTTAHVFDFGDQNDDEDDDDDVENNVQQGTAWLSRAHFEDRMRASQEAARRVTLHALAHSHFSAAPAPLPLPLPSLRQYDCTAYVASGDDDSERAAIVAPTRTTVAERPDARSSDSLPTQPHLDSRGVAPAEIAAVQALRAELEILRAEVTRMRIAAHTSPASHTAPPSPPSSSFHFPSFTSLVASPE